MSRESTGAQALCGTSLRHHAQPARLIDPRLARDPFGRDAQPLGDARDLGVAPVRDRFERRVAHAVELFGEPQTDAADAAQVVADRARARAALLLLGDDALQASHLQLELGHAKRLATDLAEQARD